MNVQRKIFFLWIFFKIRDSELGRDRIVVIRCCKASTYLKNYIVALSRIINTSLYDSLKIKNHQSLNGREIQVRLGQVNKISKSIKTALISLTTLCVNALKDFLLQTLLNDNKKLMTLFNLLLLKIINKTKKY